MRAPAPCSCRPGTRRSACRGPWDQQWSIRMQQILAYETDLLEYRRHLRRLQGRAPQGRRAEGRGQGGARAHRRHGRGRGGHRLHEARPGREQHRARAPHRGGRADRRRRQPLDGDGGVAAVGRRGRGRRRSIPAIEAEQVGAARRPGARRAMPRRSKKALAELERAAREGRNVMEPSIACAKAGVTTGEWGATLRAVFGEYRAPTGISGGVAASSGVGLDEVRGRGRARVGAGSGGASSCSSASPASTATPTAPSRSPCARATAAWRWSTRASA